MWQVIGGGPWEPWRPNGATGNGTREKCFVRESGRRAGTRRRRRLVNELEPDYGIDLETWIVASNQGHLSSSTGANRPLGFPSTIFGEAQH